MEEEVERAVLSMYKGDNRATQWLNAFSRSKVRSMYEKKTMIYIYRHNNNDDDFRNLGKRGGNSCPRVKFLTHSFSLQI